MGGHVIKCGLAPVLIDLMRRGFATGFAMNGSASIHDFEIALAGQTSEDVEAVLPDGRFGAAEETGREWNQALSRECGLGEALGAALDRLALPEYARRQPPAAGVAGACTRDRPRGHGHRYPSHPSRRESGGPRRGNAPRFPALLPRWWRNSTMAASTSMRARQW